MKTVRQAIGRVSVALVMLMVIALFSRLSQASNEPQLGSRYRIVRPVFLMAVYNSLNNRQLSRDTARAYLHATRFYEKAEVAFQVEVPVGTIMTIGSSAPKVWHLPFFASRYLVRLDPDPSRGLDVELALNRGIEGGLDGLNAEIFERYETTRDKGHE